MINPYGGYGSYGTVPTWQQFTGALVLTGGAFGLSYLFGGRNQSAAVSNSIYTAPALAPPPQPQPDPYQQILRPIDFVQDPLIPRLTGVGNRYNRFGEIMEVYGEHWVYPEHAANPVTRRSGNKQQLLLCLDLGMGEIDLDPADIKIGDKLLEEFDGVEYEILYGTAADPDITLYTQDIEELAIGDQLLYNMPVAKKAPQEADELSVDISFEQGLYNVDSLNNRSTQTVEFDVDYRIYDSGDPWTPAVDVMFPELTVTENTNAVHTVNLSWSVPRDLYEVRITRLTADTETPPPYNNSYWPVLRAILNDPPVVNPKDSTGATAYRAFLVLRIEATDQLQGNLDQIGCLVKRKLPTYDGASWTSPELTSNPAWALANLLTGPATLDALTHDDLDAEGLKAWADFCDDEGLEFNYPFDAGTTVEQAAAYICAAGRASLSITNGLWGVVIDQERETVAQWFSEYNTVADSFSISGSYPDQPHYLKTRFVNPDADWQTDERNVYDDDHTAANAYRFEAVELVGVTDADQAYKLGRYHLAAAAGRTRTIRFNVDVEHFPLERGDLIRMAHEVPGWGLGSCRIKDFETINSGGDDYVDTYILDQSLTLDLTSNPNRYFASMVRLQDGTAFFKRIQLEGTHEGDSVVTVNSLHLTEKYLADLDPAPAVGDLFMLDVWDNAIEFDLDIVADLFGQPLIIHSIEYNEDLTATVTCVDYAPDIFDAATGDLPVFETNITSRPKQVRTVPRPVVNRTQSDEAVLIEATDGSLETRVLIQTRTPPIDVSHFQYQFTRTDSEVWSPLAPVSAANNEISVVGVEGGIAYNIRIRSVTFDSFISDWTYILDYTVIGKTTKPPDLGTIEVSEDGKFLRVIGYTPPRDFAGIRGKFNRGTSDNYDAATTFAELTPDLKVDISNLPSGPLVVLLKAVDTAGNESENAASAVRSGDAIVSNVVITEAKSPTFPDEITDGTVVSGELKADDNGGLYWSTNDAALQWSGTDGDLYWTGAWLEMTYQFEHTSDAGTLSEPFFYRLAEDLDHTIEAENAYIEYRRVPPVDFWSGVDATAFWSGTDADLFWTLPFGDWLTLIGDRVPGVTGETVQFRIRTAASSITRGIISFLQLVIDMPDVIERVNNLIVGPSGTRPTLTKTFREILNISGALLADAAYPDAVRWDASDKDISGPLFNVYDAASSGTSGKIDATIQGY